MTSDQKNKLIEQLALIYPHTFHHGDCIGADSEAHDLVRTYFKKTKIVIHPPSDEKERAFKEGDRSFLPIDYLTRNKDIVDMCDTLIAAPETKDEVQRSGTWSTIRYAWKKNKRCIILIP